jgi:hypothetical protein
MNFNKLGSIGKLAGNFTGAMGQLDALVKAAKGLLCLPVVLSKFKLADAKNLLKGVGAIAAGLAAGLVGMVADMVADRINSLVNTVVGTVMGLINAVKGYITLVKKIINNVTQIGLNLKNHLKSVKIKSLDLKKFHFNTQNCAVHAANFLNCVMSAVANKITSSLLNKLNNPLRKLDSRIAKLQKDISVNAFQAGGLMEQHVGRHLRFAEKLTKQISILTR